MRCFTCGSTSRMKSFCTRTCVALVARSLPRESMRLALHRLVGVAGGLDEVLDGLGLSGVAERLDGLEPLRGVVDRSASSSTRRCSCPSSPPCSAAARGRGSPGRRRAARTRATRTAASRTEDATDMGNRLLCAFMPDAISRIATDRDPIPLRGGRMAVGVIADRPARSGARSVVSCGDAPGGRSGGRRRTALAHPLLIREIRPRHARSIRKRRCSRVPVDHPPRGRARSRPGGAAHADGPRLETLELIERIVAWSTSRSPLEVLARRSAVAAPRVVRQRSRRVAPAITRRRHAVARCAPWALGRGAAAPRASSGPARRRRGRSRCTALAERKAYVVERPHEHPFVPELVARDRGRHREPRRHSAASRVAAGRHAVGDRGSRGRSPRRDLTPRARVRRARARARHRPAGARRAPRRGDVHTAIDARAGDALVCEEWRDPTRDRAPAAAGPRGERARAREPGLSRQRAREPARGRDCRRSRTSAEGGARAVADRVAAMEEQLERERASFEQQLTAVRAAADEQLATTRAERELAPRSSRPGRPRTDELAALRDGTGRELAERATTRRASSRPRTERRKGDRRSARDARNARGGACREARYSRETRGDARRASARRWSRSARSATERARRRSRRATSSAGCMPRSRRGNPSRARAGRARYVAGRVASAAKRGEMLAAELAAARSELSELNGPTRAVSTWSWAIPTPIRPRRSVAPDARRRARRARTQRSPPRAASRSNARPPRRRAAEHRSPPPS